MLARNSNKLKSFRNDFIVFDVYSVKDDNSKVKPKKVNDAKIVLNAIRFDKTRLSALNATKAPCKKTRRHLWLKWYWLNGKPRRFNNNIKIKEINSKKTTQKNGQYVSRRREKAKKITC